MSTNNLLKTLLFNEKWLELGIITTDELQELVEEYRKSDDKNTEHYRHLAFRRFLERRRTELDDETMRALYRLGELDPDKGFGGSVMAAIIGRKDCPTDLLEEAANSDIKFVARIALQQISERKKSQ